MFSAPLNTQAVRVAITGLITAFLAVCSVSVAPGAAAAPATTTSAQHASALASSSGQSTQDDGFHW